MFEFFNSIEQTFDLVKSGCAFYLNAGYIIIAEYINNFNAETEVFKLCLFVNQVKAFVLTKLIYIYENNEFVNKAVNLFHYTCLAFFAQLQFRRIEPFAHNWTCVSALIKSYYNYQNFTYKYNELYECKEDISYSEYKELFETVRCIIKSETSIQECVVSCKFEDEYVHRICSLQLYDKPISDISVERSEIKFITIEYYNDQHSNSSPVILELKNGELLVNNELLSASFVKRMLEHQAPYHVYNKDYMIVLMDNNLRTIRLYEGDYIVLHNNYYSLMNQDGSCVNVQADTKKASSE